MKNKDLKKELLQMLKQEMRSMMMDEKKGYMEDMLGGNEGGKTIKATIVANDMEGLSEGAEKLQELSKSDEIMKAKFGDLDEKRKKKDKSENIA